MPRRLVVLAAAVWGICACNREPTAKGDGKPSAVSEAQDPRPAESVAEDTLAPELAVLFDDNLAQADDAIAAARAALRNAPDDALLEQLLGDAEARKAALLRRFEDLGGGP